MARIMEHVETEALETLAPVAPDPRRSTARALTRAAVEVGRSVGASNLVAFTETGLSAKLIARHRSTIPLLAFTPNPRVRSQLALVWGTETFLVPTVAHTDDMVVQVDAMLLDIRRSTIGERVVIVAGVPPGVPGTTNGMRVHLIGSAGEGGRGV
jgi:pyruvate kinase